MLIGEEYSFAKVAAPYAQELLDLQMAQTFAITEIGRQVGLSSHLNQAISKGSSL